MILRVRGRRRFSASRVRVVRLNCCVLDVIDATLVVMILACLVALRTEGSRLAQDANSTHRSVAGERWFDKVLDCEPLDQLASTVPSPARTLSPASPPPAGTLTDAELAVQQPGRALPADMSAPITPAALETCSPMACGGGPARFVGSTDGSEPPAPRSSRLRPWQGSRTLLLACRPRGAPRHRCPTVGRYFLLPSACR